MARQIVVDIIGDDKKFKKTLGAAGKSAEGFGSTIGGVATKVVAGGALIAGAATVAGIAIFDAGAEAEALESKFKTVFGSSAGQVEKWAKTNAMAMGLTQQEAKGLAASMGDLLIPMGFTREQAAKMSTETVGLAGALSEWTGGTISATQASEVLTKAYLGERDGLKALGISISEADVQAQLLKDGTSELTGAQLEQAKASATQKLIFAKTTDAQTAYQKGTAKGIRTQNEMKAMVGDVANQLIKNLYPVVLTVAKFMRENLPKAIQFAREAWKNIGPTVKTVIGFLTQVAKIVIPAVVKVVGTMFNLFRQWWPKISGFVASAVGTIRGVIGTVVNVFNGVTNTVRTVKTHVINAFNGIVSFVRGIPGRMSSALGNLFKPVWDGFRRFINMLIRGWNSLKFTVPSMDLGPLGKVGGFTIGTPNIPYLHSGGIVPGLPGSDVPAILQAGEQVIPRKDVGRTVHVHFHGPVYGSDQYLDQLARDIAGRLRATR